MKIKKIANLPQEKRAKELNRLPVKHLMISGFWVPVCIGFAEMGLGYCLYFSSIGLISKESNGKT